MLVDDGRDGVAGGRGLLGCCSNDRDAEQRACSVAMDVGVGVECVEVFGVGGGQHDDGVWELGEERSGLVVSVDEDVVVFGVCADERFDVVALGGVVGVGPGVRCGVLCRVDDAYGFVVGVQRARERVDCGGYANA